MAEPDLTVILKEAIAARKAGHYEGALEKYLWYYENAVRILKLNCEVRRSLNVGEWLNLAKNYPPARTKLSAIRDEMTNLVREDWNLLNLFSEIILVNDALGEGERTVELYRWLGRHNPRCAEAYYVFVESTLLELGEFALCNEFLQPEKVFKHAASVYQRELDRADPIHRQGAKQWFVERTCNLVAVLVLNDRKPEAIEYATEAKAILADAEFHKNLDKALNGVVPERWPPVDRRLWDEDGGDG